MPIPTQVNLLFERTLVLARKAWGRTHPNPMVGALIVEDGEIVAEGFHERAGNAHAEVAAFSALGRKPREGATLFVSLEPCSTHGKTPPCTEAILRSGIKKVFVACTDPNPKHAGRGIDLLGNAGVEVELAPDSVREKAERMNFIFNHNMRTGGPLVALKLSESANGMVAEQAGRPSQVTQEKARGDVMRWRRLFPAICVGSGTVLSDDPTLTARLPDETWCPVRILVDSSLSTLRGDITSRKVYVDEFSARTVILTTAKGTGHAERVARAKELGIRLIETGEGQGGGIDPVGLRAILFEFGFNALYCEGGPTLARSLLESSEIDYLFHYRSSKLFEGTDALPGPGLDGYPVREPIEEMLGEDRLVHGFL